MDTILDTTSGSTTGSASDSDSAGCGSESHPDVQIVTAMVLGLREAAERDLAGASLAIQKAQELRESAMEKLALAEEVAKLYAERVPEW